MTDSQRLYRMIREGLKRMYPSEPEGNFARNLNTLTGFICGIIRSGQVKLSEIANEIPGSGKEESKIMKLRRWLQNEAVDADIYFMPLIEYFIAGLSNNRLVFVIDGTTAGKNCVTLMVSVIYKGRALPVIWITREGKKGHFPESMHIEIIKSLKEVVPDYCDVICLGDGEFDGTDWLHTLESFGWHYVCRTSKNSVFYENDCEKFIIKDICPERGGCTGIKNLLFTEKKYGPVMGVAWWGEKYKEPVYLVSDCDTAEEACFWYKKRFRIETLFSDCKSRGFNLDKTGLKDPKRISRLLIAIAIAYIWVVCIGEYSIRKGLHKVIHRKDRCDLSLFQLGRRLLKRFLREGIKIPKFGFYF